jgi:hypothetical protein
VSYTSELALKQLLSHALLSFDIDIDGLDQARVLGGIDETSRV